MCGGVRYTIKKETFRVFFPNPYAKLPVLMRDGKVSLVPWGRRKQEDGNLPLGGWARLESVDAGKWDYLQPRPVKIAVDAFMEKDHNKDSHWFNMEPDTFIQGLYASKGDEARIYVVTVEPGPLERPIHDRWPRIVGYEEKTTTNLTPTGYD